MFTNSPARFGVAVLKDYIDGSLTVVRINQKALLRKSKKKFLREFLLFKIEINDVFVYFSAVNDSKSFC